MTQAPTVTHPAEALILAKLAPTVVERARQVRLMCFDIDGVLTDGSLWYSEHGEAVKRFNALDGHGLRLMRESGIAIALITGREGPIVAHRAADLGISMVLQGIRDKLAAVTELAAQESLTLDQVGFMGDDLLDLYAMQRVGFAASVPNAPGYITQAAHWVSSREGGQGAARECCDLILAAQGRLAAFFNPNAVILGGVAQ
ncbi:HAD hydrolase family protein [Pusillimonas sp. CC-YST705]|uniref:HAD hydrolase family protein n=1 Tax=Mesopusillimonas faecipullorum TaxID=2755040 RepID=A0ABS8CCB7_9BURK|nr:HAD hydrolase family protein [Mesopusillimonas faecipullorum]MCB5363680.1 HAD hydrolase family protein [Mesopusillimonas faecipullorum]